MRLIPLIFFCTIFSINVSAQEVDSLIQKNIPIISGKLKGILPIIADTTGIKQDLDQLKKIIKHPAFFNNISAEFSRKPFTYPFDSTGYYFSDLGNINAEVTIGGIPVMVDYRYLHFSDPFTGQSLNNFSFKFDKDTYLKQLKDKLKTKYNPEELLQSFKNDVLEKAKNKALKLLQSDISAIKDKYKGRLNSLLSKGQNIKDIFNTDISTLTARFLNPRFLSLVKQSENQLSQLQQRINLGEHIDTKLLDSLRNTVSQYDGLKEIIQKIQDHKSKWLSSLLSGDLKQLQQLKNTQTGQFLKDPSSIRQLAHEKLSLSGIQKLLLKAERLDIGQNALTLSPLTLQNFISTGINAEFINKNKYFMVSAGQQPVMNSIWDNPFSNNINNSVNKVLGMGFGKGSISNDSYSRFSLFTYQTVNSTNFGISTYQPQKSTLVATINNKIKVGERGSITAEISRSAVQYKNERNPLDSSLTNKTSLNNLLSTENFGKSLAFSLDYSDEYPKLGLSHEVEIKSVANGYYNPGNNFLPSGTKEIKFDIRKTFFERKLQLSARADVREYKYNDAVDKKWRNANYMVDVRWKFKKGQYIGFRFQPLTMRRIENDLKYTVNASDRLAANGNIYQKIRPGLYYRHYINLAFQKNQYQLNAAESIDNKSILINSQQSIIIKKNMVFWNTVYNHVNNSLLFYFNTSLNSDAGISYQVLKTFSASTSIGYRSVKGWYNQVAFRQSVSGELGKRFSINLYLDAAKNITLFQAMPYSPVRAEWSLKYMFKN